MTRLRLIDPGVGGDSPLVRGLVAEGITDFLASPMHFIDGTAHVATWTIRHPKGFTGEHASAIEAIIHLGEIRCGNIGGGDRLDFTCIGPAINLVARLEELAGTLGRSIVASESFALHCGRAFSPLGQFALKGFTRKQRVYGFAEGAP
jgi:adenylate cyclase